MSRNGLTANWKRERLIIQTIIQTNHTLIKPLIIQTTTTTKCGRALKGRYMLLLRVCSRTALVRTSERSPCRSDHEGEGDEHFRESEL